MFISALLWAMPLIDKFALLARWAALVFFVVTFILIALSLSVRIRIIRLVALALFIIIYAAFSAKPVLGLVILKNLSLSLVIVFAFAFVLNAVLLFIPAISLFVAIIDCLFLVSLSLFSAIVLKTPMLFVLAFIIFLALFFTGALKKRGLFLPFRVALALAFALAPLAFVSNSSNFYSIFDRFLPTHTTNTSPYVSRVDKAIEESVDLNRVSFGFIWPKKENVIGVFEMHPTFTGFLSIFKREGGELKVKRLLTKVTAYTDCLFPDYAYIAQPNALVKVSPDAEILSTDFILPANVEIQTMMCNSASHRMMFLAEKSGAMYIYRQGSELPDALLFLPRAIDRFLSNFHMLFLEYSPISPMAIGATFFADGKIGILATIKPFTLQAFVLDQDLRVLWRSEPFSGSQVGWVTAVEDKLFIYQNLSGKVRVLDTKSWTLEQVPHRITPKGGHIVLYDPVGKFLIITFYDGRIVFVDPDSFETFEVAQVGMRTHVPQLLADERLLVIANFSGIFKVDLKAVDEIYRRWKSSRGVQDTVHKR